jgi:type VII secretion-associated serine protease mycosin
LSRALASLLALIVLVGLATPAAADEPEPDPVRTGDPQVIPGEVIVTYRDGTARERAGARGLAVLADLGTPGRGVPALVSTRGRPVDVVVAELRADPAVARAEPNYRVQLVDDGAVAAVAVDDPITSGQYSLDRMRVRDAWSRDTGARNLIAVLDTGVQSSHPDLAGRVVRGYDFVNDDRFAADDNGHGTWVAGIIAANANDGYGMAGISWSDKILPVKIMNREGTGSTSDLIAAIRWSADKGADIINMSVGGFPYSQIMQDAVNYAFRKGAVLVGAAGNNHREERFYPASFDNVISVSATQVNDEFSNWSSYGPAVDVSAPGSSVLTTNCFKCTYADHDSWGAHTYISGTSFATPNVSGVLALIRARYPDATPQQVVNRLFNTVDDLGYAGWDKRYGRGRVNAHRALGASVPYPSRPRGDSMERNNGLASAVKVRLGSTTRPSIYPAGDVDVFAVDVPRAGRLDVRVGGVVDSRAYPWNKSGLPVDPIVELYTRSGTFIKRVDNEWESGTEVARVSVKGWTRILVRILNYYPNGNREAYALTPKFVDTIAPTATVVSPSPGEADVSRFIDPVVVFSEKVTNVTPTTLVLREVTTGVAVPTTVVLNPDRRRAKIVTPDRLDPLRRYRVEVRSTITDLSGNALVAANRGFTTGLASFTDTAGTVFEREIEWLYASGITRGCTQQRFCPKEDVTRAEMATFLSRAFDLPATERDYFTDDETSTHEDNINRVAAAGVTRGCRATKYCPTGIVSRAQMASSLARALALPPAEQDYFRDDDGTAHEDSINRMAAAGITTGCGDGVFCPNGSVSRQGMAALLYRALSDPG